MLRRPTAAVRGPTCELWTALWTTEDRTTIVVPTVGPLLHNYRIV